MSLAKRVVVWNSWYDRIPEDWRFQFVLWSLLGLGTINMLLTVVSGFPFALLVVIGIIALTVIRVPYVLGWVTPVAGPASDAQFQIEGAGWLIDLNRRYEAMPEHQRFWIYPAILLIGGAINMMLTIAYGFPFGLLFLLTLVALVLIRAPYTAGWLKDPAPVHRVILAKNPSPPLAFDPPPADVQHDVFPLEHDATTPSEHGPGSTPGESHGTASPAEPHEDAGQA